MGRRGGAQMGASLTVGIDASRATREQRTGTEGYSLHLLRALLRLDASKQYVLYYNSPPQPGLMPDFAHVEQRVIPFPRLWTHVRLSWEMARRPPDVLFVPAHVLPLVHPRRSVVTIHDLGYYHEPDAHPPRQRAYLEWATRYNAQSAAHIIVDSEATKRDLVSILGISAEKIRVVYLGVDERFRPLRDPVQIAAAKATYGIASPYILYVGTLQPRKNLVRLVEAFGRVVRAVETGYEGASPYAGGARGKLSLVLAGGKGWWYEDIFRTVQEMELGSRVIFPGYVKDDDLPALYSGAELFVFPSLYEGFGLPILEAMACGAPVVCSNASSLPEVAGDAALTVAPDDVAGLAAALAPAEAAAAFRGRVRWPAAWAQR